MRLTKQLQISLLALVAAVPISTACGPTETTCADGVGCVPDEGGSSAAGTPGASGKGGGGAGGKGGAAGGGSSAAGEAGNTAGGTSDMGGAGAGMGGEGGSVPMLPCDGMCINPKPICDEPNDKCVECLKEQDCSTGAKKKCDATAKTCVECLGATDCPTAAAAKCESGACVKCTSNDDCQHIPGKKVCDTGAGACVQCTAADESACAGKSCNPATKACTDTNVGSRDYCQSCLADSECLGGNKADPDARCVPMEFNGTPRTGGFCLKRSAKTCAKPFQTPIAVASLSGAPSEQYCGIDQENVRCEAVLDLIGDAACSDGLDTSCGCARDMDGNCTNAGAGGLCRIVGVNPNKCTYTCGASAQCPTGFTCTGAQPYCH
ncbi:MAG TPA: hypothetical protein VJN18_01630 [Polyangiaceae bacterium]|nr:hypothetical protein [Polyangiaceae bacterium]